MLGDLRVAARGSDLLDLVLPRECGGCLRPGDEWCARCERALAALAFASVPGQRALERGRTRTPTGSRARTPCEAADGTAEWASPTESDPAVRRGGGAPWVVPHRAPVGMPPVHAWGVYADPLRAAVSAWKDAGRRDLERVLRPLLASSVQGALADSCWVDGVVLVVPAPSSRHAVRQRGDTPLLGLCSAAATDVGGSAGVVLRVAPALEHVRRVEDQSGLGTAGRRGNLSGALRVKPLWRNVVRGRRCLLVDDVVTTGATLAEAARALRDAGAGPVLGATLAATQRTRG